MYINFRRDAIAPDEESQCDSFETVSLNQLDLDLQSVADNDDVPSKAPEKEIGVKY